MAGAEERAGRSSFCLARRSSISRSRAAVSTGLAPPKMEAVVGAGVEGGAAEFSLATTSSAGFVRGCRFSLCLVLGSLPINAGILMILQMNLVAYNKKSSQRVKL